MPHFRQLLCLQRSSWSPIQCLSVPLAHLQKLGTYLEHWGPICPSYYRYHAHISIQVCRQDSLWSGDIPPASWQFASPGVKWLHPRSRYYGHSIWFEACRNPNCPGTSGGLGFFHTSSSRPSPSSTSLPGLTFASQSSLTCWKSPQCINWFSCKEQRTSRYAVGSFRYLISRFSFLSYHYLMRNMPLDHSNFVKTSLLLFKIMLFCFLCETKIFCTNAEPCMYVMDYA